jgi:hypothetical protein
MSIFQPGTILLKTGKEQELPLNEADSNTIGSKQVSMTAHKEIGLK